MSNYYNSETLLEQQAEIEKLKAERDALAAQVEVLRSALEPFAATGLPSCVEREDCSVMQERVKDWFGVNQFKKAIEAYNQTPAACLAHVRAEAITAALDYIGYPCAAHQGSAPDFTNGFNFAAEQLRNLANRIRQGGAE